MARNITNKGLTYIQKGTTKEKTPEELVGELLEGIDELEKETQQYEFLCNKQVESENEYKKQFAQKYLTNKHTGDMKTVNEVESKTLTETITEKIQSDLDKALVDVQKQRIKNVVTKIDVYRSLLSFVKSDKEFSGYQ